MSLQMTHHAINYIEFTVRDLEEAKQFYGAAFGWQFNDYGPEYVGICHKEGEGEVGGFCKGESQPGGPLVILYSANLEDSLKAVESAGGTISKEIISFPGGRRFQFQDPSSNELAVWSDK